MRKFQSKYEIFLTPIQSFKPMELIPVKYEVTFEVIQVPLTKYPYEHDLYHLSLSFWCRCLSTL